MMKNPIFWLLLSLLLLGMTPRDSSALALARVNGTTANNMIAGINLLTESITWLQDNMPSYKYFHGTIDNIEEDILRIPIELAEERYEMLAMLYISKDRFHEARAVLEMASKKLKSKCSEIIEVINNNDYSEMLVIYTAKNIVKHLSLFNDILEVASDKLRDIHHNLSHLKANLVDFNSTLRLKAEKINETFENKEHIFPMFDTDKKISKQQEMAEVTFEIPAGTNFRAEIIAFIKQLSIQNPKIILQSDNEGNENPPVKIEKAMESISELLSKVAKIHNYIVNDRDIITKYENSLEASISEYEDISLEDIDSMEDIDSREDIDSMEDIEFNFRKLKVSINALRNACSSYLNQYFS